MGTKAETRTNPWADRVVIKALDDSEQMRGGLYIPDTAKEKPSQGEAVAVGPEKILDDGVGNPQLRGRDGHCGGHDAKQDEDGFRAHRREDEATAALRDAPRQTNGLDLASTTTHAFAVSRTRTSVSGRG